MNITQNLTQQLAAQFGHPTGLWGTLAGWIMATRSSNLERSDWAISLLQLQPTDRVLEIGFGPGVAIQQMSRIVTAGRIWGIDHSELMLKQASERNHRAIEAGQVRLLLGSVEALPHYAGPFDKILDVNSFQFWQRKVETLKSLRSRLRPGGRLALVNQPRRLGATEADATKAAEEYANYLEAAGFSEVRVERKAMKPVSAVAALGRRS